MSHPLPVSHDPIRARALVDDPVVPAILGALVARASRQCPHLADEFEAHSWLSLWSAAVSYPADTSVPWPAYLSVRLRCDMKDFRRSWMGTHGQRGEYRVERPAMVSLDEPRAGEESASIGDVIPSDDLPVGWEVDSEDAVEAMTRTVVGRRGVAIRAMFLRCADGLDDLAGKMGIPFGTMKHYRWKAVTMIREAMERKGMGVAG